MLANHLISFFYKIIMVIPHICNMDQTFDRIRKFYINSPFCHTGDHALILSANMSLHILCFFQFDHFTLGLFRCPLPLTALRCNFGQNLSVMLHPFPGQPSPQIFLDDPMDLKIRISADRRSEMRIIFRCQSKMPCIFCCIFCLLH